MDSFYIFHQNSCFSDASKQSTPGSGASSPRPAVNPTKPSPQPLNRQSQASGGGRNNKKKKKGKR